MKKNQMKNKFKLFSLVAFFGAVLFSGLFAIQVKPNTKNFEETVTNAVSTNVTSDVVTELSAEPTVLAESFNLRDSYPLVAENQTTSNYCWIYSSAKVLESSLMVQKNEHINISESAIAYLAYKNKINGEASVINADGNFKTFSNTIATCGLVYESDFSNDNYFDFDLTGANANNYSYIEKLTDKSLVSSLSTVAFTENTTYSALSLEEKQQLLKKYIVKYGGLFVGIEEGVVVGNSEPYIYSTDQSTEAVKTPIYQKHAVCLVGWNDEYGFLALNSWGTDISEFYIPFNYAYSYTNENSLYGFLVGEQKINIAETSASLFDSYTGYDADLKNVFCYGETISLKYSIDSSLEFEQIYIDVFKGGVDVSDSFVIGYDDANSKVSLALNGAADIFVGGDYCVRFYEGSKLASTKSFFVFTGTEISYFNISTKSNGVTVLDSELLQLGYLSSTNSVTYYLSPTGNNYVLAFSLTDLNMSDRTNEALSYSIGLPYVYQVSDSGVVSEQATGVKINKNTSFFADSSNLYEMTIMGLGGYKGMMISFDIVINSNVSEMSSCVSTYKVNIFVSNLLTTKTTNAYAIEYVLDGGKNSTLNVDRYPNFEAETTMTEVALYEPTKDGQTFLGWYLDKNFTTKVTKIDKTFASDIALYAKWEKAVDVTYYTTAFEKKNILDYSGKTKTSATNALVYGDVINLDYTFTPTEEIAKHAFYSIDFKIYLNNQLKSTTELENKTQVITTTFGFPNEKVGNYTVRVEVVLVISHNKTVTDSKEIKFSVAQKEITPVFSNTEVSYDGKAHMPTVAYKTGDVYAEDASTFTIRFLHDSKTEAGSYTYDSIEINNENYKLADGSSCVLVIKQIGLKLVWDKTTTVFNGTAQAPTYKLEGLLAGDTTNIYISAEEMINAGTYQIVVDKNSALNKNYYLAEAEDCEFVITKAPIKVIINDVTDRTETDPIYRKPIANNFTVEGDYYCTLEELAITLASAGLTAEENGEYAITGKCANNNYEVTFENGVYTLTGFYYVYYKLPNGETYVEIVEAGKDPKGIDDEIYKTSIFEKLIYSEPLEATGYDLHITVTVKNYTSIVVIAAVVVAFVIVYLIITRKHRRNKVG